LLLGIERCHVGERPSHHPASRVGVRRLRDGNERNLVFRFQAFQFDVVEQVSRSSIHFVEQQAIQRRGVLLRVGNQLSKGLAFIGFAGRLGNAKETDDLSILLNRVPTQRFFLNFQCYLFRAAWPPFISFLG
jgi:hypothetical protein